MPVTTWSQSWQAMEQKSSQLGIGTSDPQLNPDLGTNPSLSESVLVSFYPLNLVTPEETMVNQLDEINISANHLDQCLSNT